MAKTISIFDRNILSRGYPTKLEYYGNPRVCVCGGGGGVTWGVLNKSALRGGDGYFLELHISCSRFLCPLNFLNGLKKVR